MTDLLAVIFPMLLVDILSPVLLAAMIFAAGSARPVLNSGAILLGHNLAYLVVGLACLYGAFSVRASSIRRLGTLLSGNTMSAWAQRVTLEEVLTDEVYATVGEHVDEIVAGMDASIERYNAPFLVEKMGNRISLAFAWNRHIMIMPYFNMLIVTPQHSLKDTDRW